LGPAQRIYEHAAQAENSVSGRHLPSTFARGFGGTSVMSRANGKGAIFETHVDQQDFIKTLAEKGSN
jgi:hypothetical protein